MGLIFWEKCFGDVNKIELFQDRVQWQTLVLAVLNLELVCELACKQHVDLTMSTFAVFVANFHMPKFIE
jgi:hypothetical protein